MSCHIGPNAELEQGAVEGQPEGPEKATRGGEWEPIKITHSNLAYIPNLKIRHALSLGKTDKSSALGRTDKISPLEKPDKFSALVKTDEFSALVKSNKTDKQIRTSSQPW
jgi:hypothetical protein